MQKIASKFLLMVSLFIVGANANAVVTIEIDQGVIRGIPIAIVPFGVSSDIETSLDLDEVIRSDLSKTGRFEVKDPNDYLDNPTNVSDIKFTDWQLIETDYLVIGSVEPVDDGHYRIEARLFDVFEEKQIVGNQYLVSAESVRKTMHTIANTVYESVTGNKSSFDTRIAYTITSVSAENQIEHKLVVADYDGHNPSVLLKTGNPILSPTWSPDSEKIAYSILGKHQSKIWIQEVSTGERYIVAEFDGQNRAPNWSPDGSMLAFANSRDANSDIYILTLANGQLTRLTKDRQIDTEPAWSPDGEYIVFTSSRGKKAQIYRVRSQQNQQVERVTFDGESNARARYSPSGEQLILITDQGAGNQVGIYDFDENTIKVVSTTSIDDCAIFSPNGDMLMYIVEGQDRHIRILSPDGRVQTRVKTIDGAVKQVAWSKNS